MPKNEFICDCNAIHLHLVEQALAQMPKETDLARLADFYKILADPTRCKLICALQQQELCVCDLANILSMSKSSVSHQLSKMKDAGVVRCRRSGKEVYYALDDDHIRQIFSVTMVHIRHKHQEAEL